MSMWQKKRKWIPKTTVRFLCLLPKHCAFTTAKDCIPQLEEWLCESVQWFPCPCAILHQHRCQVPFLHPPSLSVKQGLKEGEKIKLSFSNTNNHREENGKKRNLLGKIRSLKYRVWNIWKWSWCMVKLPLPLPFSDWARMYCRCTPTPNFIQLLAWL